MKGTQQKPALLLGVFILFLGLTGVASFFASRELFVTWTLPGITTTPFTPQELTPTLPTPQPTPPPELDLTRPLQPPAGPAPSAWNGDHRITILLMGVDTRTDAPPDIPPRSDTLILFTYDPRTNTAGMFSIPRDLWVAIPGFGSGKVNTAYQLGEAYRTDGGGPGLAMKTLETLLGIPIDAYALVDFQLFVRLIDEIGGVKLDVPEEIEISRVDMEGTKWLLPGVQTLPGAETLAYVRARNTPGGDFDRVQRQQAVLMAIRERILTFDLLPALIAKAPLLYGEFSDRIRTNLTANQIFKLAIAMQGVPAENILLSAVTLEDVTFSKAPNGTDILLPIPERVRHARDDVFFPDDPQSTVQSSKTITQLMEEEGAKIAVLNGTTTPGIAAKVTDLLKAKDLNITLSDSAEEIYSLTTIIDYTGNPNTVKFLVEYFKINPENILRSDDRSYDPTSKLDIKIILGEDWVSNGDLP